MTTDRLIIREITLDDIDELYDIYADEEVTKYIDNLYENREDEIEFTKAYIKNMYGFYEYGMWIVQKKDGKVIGRAGISNREVDGESELEIGYLIGKPYQRRGYGYEAVSAIVNYAFDELEAEKLNCFIREGNHTSEKFAERLGFEKNSIVKSEDTEYIRYVRMK